MNVYDFDGTIYDGDSTKDFYKFCLKNYPKTRRTMWSALGGFSLYLLGLTSKTAFKEQFFSFLRFVTDIDYAVTLFWHKYDKKLKPWYLMQKQSDDVIISASPEFLLIPVCKKLGVRLIASRIDSSTGVIRGENCRGNEKTRRFKEEYGDSKIVNFYSDSLSDSPLAEISENAFFVKRNKVYGWVKKDG